VDVACACAFLQEEGLDGLSVQVVHDAIGVVAHEGAFHPLRDWLSGLSWDGVPRVEHVFTDYFRAEEDEYTRWVGRVFCIGTGCAS